LAPLVLSVDVGWEEFMLNVTIENIGDLAVVECEGRLVKSEAAFKLREAVMRKQTPELLSLNFRK
jgi:hypothetical protein